MNIEWPESILPFPSVNYGINTDGRLMVQEMEVGTRQRRRFSDDGERVSVSWQLTTLQWAFFKTFVSDTLGHGAAGINLTLLTANGLERVNAKILGGKYQTKYLNYENYEISATLEVIAPPTLPETLYWLYTFLEGEKYTDSWLAFNDRLYTVTESRNIIP